MKQKDIALIIMIVAISGAVSLFVSSRFTVSSQDRQQKVEVVDAIDPSFAIPSKDYFNEQSVDLTQLITIGDTKNPDPFNGE